MGSVQCAVCSVQCAVCSVQCAVCSVPYAVRSFSVQYAVYKLNSAVCREFTGVCQECAVFSEFTGTKSFEKLAPWSLAHNLFWSCATFLEFNTLFIKLIERRNPVLLLLLLLRHAQWTPTGF